MSTIERAVAIPAGTWSVDFVHSSVGFEVRHSLVATFRGAFTKFAATLESGEDGTVLTGSAPVESVSVQDETLNAHLLSPDFFDAERHPELRFHSTLIRHDGDEVVLDGELTIKGVTRPVELRGTVAGPVTDAYGRERLGLDLEGTIDRTDFGLNWNAPLPGGGFILADDVKLVARLSLVREG